MIPVIMKGVFQKAPNVALFLATGEKSGRDKFEGILRYMRLHTPWNIHLIDNCVGEQQLVSLKAWGVNGVIIARMPDAVTLVQRVSVPAVVMDSPALYEKHLSKASYVINDSEAVGAAGAAAFIKRGFREFAYVASPYEWDWSAGRERGFRDCLARSDFNCAVYGHLTARERKDWTLDQQRLLRWLRGLPKPVAVLAADDARARQVLETCQLAGISVPGEIALLGIDNDEFVCENTSPTLSSIQPDFDAGGYEAAALLEQLMRRALRSPQKLFYGVKRVVERESSRFAHAVDRRCLRGLEFIRLNACAAISVPDVSCQMGVSRRLAEILFSKHVGHSILTEIQRVRLARLKTFLSETALPIGQISWQCGYQSDLHAKRVFKRETGMTMSRFRQQSRQTGEAGARGGHKGLYVIKAGGSAL
ncbi:MAG: DNA-binding transcriptional regulator [Kiritimatiellae bacterium]|nr:DNA-binding transcriptional regulator [Kiritimatiellia bacterium]